LQCLKAEYGRYFNSKSEARWGWGVNAKFAWFTQETPMLALPVYYMLSTGRLGWNPNSVLLSFIIIHYFRRVFIYSFQLKGGKPTPISLWLMCIVYTLTNGYIHGRYFTEYAKYDKKWLSDPRFLCGTLMFFTGLFLNIQSDNILTSLRKPGEVGYKIPRGGLFEYVSGANFCSEILEWSGFALASCSYPGFTYAFFTLCNVGPRAIQHHKFYVEKFEDYPKSRKALIPWLL
ncbi:predicted protein, partial [Nematostella vectensis]